MLVDFTLPIYNEEKILEENVLKLRDFLLSLNPPYQWRLVLLVNGSRDQSYQIAQELEKKYPATIMAVNIPEPGRGQALKKYWLKSEADILAYMDADLATSLNNIPDLINPLFDDKYQISSGCRLTKKSDTERSWSRELISRGYNLLSRLILDHHFLDLQCGFKAINKKAFLALAESIQDPNWFFDTELMILGQKAGQTILEVPISWSESRSNDRKSTVKVFRDSWLFLKNLIKFRKRLRQMI